MKNKRKEDSEALIGKTKENKEKELTLAIEGDSKAGSLKTQIKLFEKRPDIVKTKVENSEYYSNWYSDSHTTLTSMRMAWKAYCDEQDLSLIQKAIEATTKKLTKEEPQKHTKSKKKDTQKEQKAWLSAEQNFQLIQKIINEQEAKTPLTEETIDIIREQYVLSRNAMYASWIDEKIVTHLGGLDHNYKTRVSSLESEIHRPIVWGLPNVTRGLKGFSDDFIYPSNTSTKVVYIPFTDIHNKLAKSNWIIKSEASIQSNYLIAHLVFVVSNKLHSSDSETKYEGERIFIDFPITGREVMDFTQKHEENGVGQYYNAAPRGHSENALVNLLHNPTSIKNMVTFLKKKLISNYVTQGYEPPYNDNSADKFKVYAVNLFINSRRNTCGDCEKTLYKLMASHEDNSFLSLLLIELNSQNLITPTKNDKCPYMFITIVSNIRDNATWHQTLTKDAKIALKDDPAPIEKSYKTLSVDIKELAGKVILSTAEKWLYGMDDAKEHKSHMSDIVEANDKIPFYSGFKSGKDIETIEWDSESVKYEYENPVCFDGIDITWDLV